VVKRQQIAFIVSCLALSEESSLFLCQPLAFTVNFTRPYYVGVDITVCHKSTSIDEIDNLFYGS